MNAVILAAGTGSRLVSATRYLPKALVEVHKRPLIDYTLDFVKSMQCQEISVVGGFYYEKLYKHLMEQDPDIHIYENSDFLKGNALSLMAALENQTDSFLLLNVDHIYPAKMGRAFLKTEQKQSTLTAFVDFDRPLGEDDMKVQLTNDNKIQRISKTLQAFDAGYIGMTYIPKEQLQQYKLAAQKVTEEDSGAVVENILQQLVENGQSPSIFDASGIRWLEVDNQNDLFNAERILSHIKEYLA